MLCIPCLDHRFQLSQLEGWFWCLLCVHRQVLLQIPAIHPKLGTASHQSPVKWQEKKNVFWEAKKCKGLSLHEHNSHHKFTWVVLQYSPMITLAKGSLRPDASEPIKDLAWYMWALTWKNWKSKLEHEWFAKHHCSFKLPFS